VNPARAPGSATPDSPRSAFALTAHLCTQRNTATVSRFESGEYPIRRPDLMALLDLYGVSERRKRDGLLRLSEDVWQKGWWDGYKPDVECQFVDYMWLESRATAIRAFDCVVLPGLLQTREYAEAVITAADRDPALGW
jgi:hypothetical protein